MEITLIAALTRDRMIGTENGGIPWDLPRDRDHFRMYSAGKVMLIGRRTFEEMQGWFTDQHTPIVLTQSQRYESSSVQNAYSVEEAIEIARRLQTVELVVAGGADTYAAALPHATQLILTWVEDWQSPLPKPIQFPTFNRSEWTIVASKTWPADRLNKVPMTLEFLKKVSG